MKILRSLAQFFFFFFTLLISSCLPKLVTKYTGNKYPIVNPYESFGVIESDTITFNNDNLIGQIEIKDNGFSINCDYFTIIEQIKSEARKAGGNLIRIDEHKKPSTYGSSCHQIKASIFRVDNPRLYEEKIYWHSNRKLIVKDFKGSSENRPFQAMTMSGIEFYVKQKPLNRGFDIRVRALFDCFKSYFKISDLDSLILEHEQLHFDITEIYARRFYNELIETKLDPNNFDNQTNKLYNIIITELSKKQDEYDSEVYLNPQLQAKWNLWVKDELKNNLITTPETH